MPIRVSLEEGSRRNLSTIENMPVPTTGGGSVPLKVVADISFGAGPSVIQRINQDRRITIGADLAPGVVDGETIVNQLPIMQNLPEGVERARSASKREEAKLVSEFLDRPDFRDLPGLRGAGAALQAADGAVREHGLAAARAARRR